MATIDTETTNEAVLIQEFCDSREPICYFMVKEAEYTPAIKVQTVSA